MKHYAKRILSFLMAVCVLVGLVPMIAAADETQANVQFVGQQLSLSDDLTMRFYVTLDEASAELRRTDNLIQQHNWLTEL